MRLPTRHKTPRTIGAKETVPSVSGQVKRVFPGTPVLAGTARFGWGFGHFNSCPQWGHGVVPTGTEWPQCLQRPCRTGTAAGRGATGEGTSGVPASVPAEEGETGFLHSTGSSRVRSGSRDPQLAQNRSPFSAGSPQWGQNFAVCCREAVPWWSEPSVVSRTEDRLIDGGSFAASWIAGTPIGPLTTKTLLQWLHRAIFPSAASGTESSDPQNLHLIFMNVFLVVPTGKKKCARSAAPKERSYVSRNGGGARF